MSSSSWADAPTPVFATEQFPLILSAVIAAKSNDRSAPRILGLREPGERGVRGQSYRPHIALRLSEGLIDPILASGVIYSLRTPRVADDFYIEYFQEQQVLLLKYQKILGSRLLIRMTDAQAAQFEETVLRLQAQKA